MNCNNLNTYNDAYEKAFEAFCNQLFKSFHMHKGVPITKPYVRKASSLPNMTRKGFTGGQTASQSGDAARKANRFQHLPEHATGQYQSPNGFIWIIGSIRRIGFLCIIMAKRRGGLPLFSIFELGGILLIDRGIFERNTQMSYWSISVRKMVDKGGVGRGSKAVAK
jgi:hypothetical protein